MTTIQGLHGTVKMQDQQIKQLTEENTRLSNLCDKWNTECDEMREDNKRLDGENARLRDALEDAATSLETIAVRSYGDESYINTMPQVRGYAQARASVAREALKGQP